MLALVIALHVVVLVGLWWVGRHVMGLRSQVGRSLGLLEEILKSDIARSARQEAIRHALTSEDQRAQVRARVAARLGKA